MQMQGNRYIKIPTRAVTPEQRLEAIKTLKSIDYAKRLELLQDPWTFLVTCVYSSDEDDPNGELKPAPTDEIYLARLVEQFLTKDRILVAKSRQMWITWLYVSLCLHRVMTTFNQRVHFVSLNRETADALIKRAELIWNNIPEDIWPKELRPELVRKEYEFVSKGLNSGMYALPSGPDASRSHTASITFDDEAGIYPKLKETITGQLPSTRKIIICSSVPEVFGAEMHYFDQILYDRVTS